MCGCLLRDADVVSSGFMCCVLCLEGRVCVSVMFFIVDVMQIQDMGRFMVMVG